MTNRNSKIDEPGASWRSRLIEDPLRDIIYGVRNLRRSPSFTVAAVLTLALAIAANAAIFAVVERVVLNPLPYPNSDRLIQLDHGFPAINIPAGVGLTAGLYYQYLDRARSLAGVAIYRTDELTLRQLSLCLCVFVFSKESLTPLMLRVVRWTSVRLRDSSRRSPGLRLRVPGTCRWREVSGH